MAALKSGKLQVTGWCEYVAWSVSEDCKKAAACEGVFAALRHHHLGETAYNHMRLGTMLDWYQATSCGPSHPEIAGL